MVFCAHTLTCSFEYETEWILSATVDKTCDLIVIALWFEKINEKKDKRKYK